MKKYTVYLKNGASVSFRCKNFSVTYSYMNDKVIEYEMKGAVAPYPVFIKSDEIVMVVKEEGEDVSAVD